MTSVALTCLDSPNFLDRPLLYSPLLASPSIPLTTLSSTSSPAAKALSPPSPHHPWPCCEGTVNKWAEPLHPPSTLLPPSLPNSSFLTFPLPSPPFSPYLHHPHPSSNTSFPPSLLSNSFFLILPLSFNTFSFSTLPQTLSLFLSLSPPAHLSSLLSLIRFTGLHSHLFSFTTSLFSPSRSHTAVRRQKSHTKQLKFTNSDFTAVLEARY